MLSSALPRSLVHFKREFHNATILAAILGIVAGTALVGIILLVKWIDRKKRRQNDPSYDIEAGMTQIPSREEGDTRSQMVQTNGARRISMARTLEVQIDTRTETMSSSPGGRTRTISDSSVDSTQKSLATESINTSDRTLSFRFTRPLPTRPSSVSDVSASTASPPVNKRRPRRNLTLTIPIVTGGMLGVVATTSPVPPSAKSPSSASSTSLNHRSLPGRSPRRSPRRTSTLGSRRKSKPASIIAVLPPSVKGVVVES